jgi:hypothetical protein
MVLADGAVLPVARSLVRASSRSGERSDDLALLLERQAVDAFNGFFPPFANFSALVLRPGISRPLTDPQAHGRRRRRWRYRSE